MNLKKISFFLKKKKKLKSKSPDHRSSRPYLCVDKLFFVYHRNGTVYDCNRATWESGTADDEVIGTERFRR